MIFFEKYLIRFFRKIIKIDFSFLIFNVFFRKKIESKYNIFLFNLIL